VKKSTDQNMHKKVVTTLSYLDAGS